jgi:hypothetical protein
MRFLQLLLVLELLVALGSVSLAFVKVSVALNTEHRLAESLRNELEAAWRMRGHIDPAYTCRRKL